MPNENDGPVWDSMARSLCDVLGNDLRDSGRPYAKTLALQNGIIYSAGTVGHGSMNQYMDALYFIFIIAAI